MNCLKKYFTDYQSPSVMYKTLRETEGVRNETRVYLIKLVLDRMKKTLIMCLKIENL